HALAPRLAGPRGEPFRHLRHARWRPGLARRERPLAGVAGQDFQVRRFWLASPHAPYPPLLNFAAIFSKLAERSDAPPFIKKRSAPYCISNGGYPLPRCTSS